MGDENKQFEASQQKLRKAREQGQVVKSKDLSIAIAIIVMFSAIYLLGPIIWGQLSALFVMIYEQIPNKHLDEIGYSYIFIKSVIPATLITLPILVLAGFIGIFGDMVQIGPLFTTKPMEFNAEKFNPTKYFKNIMFNNAIKTNFRNNIFRILHRNHV